MQISPINSLNFKARLGYDDEISSKKREHIRRRLYDQYSIDNNDVFVQNNRLEEYSYNKLMEKLGVKSKKNKTQPRIVKEAPNKPDEVNYNIMMELPLCNVEPIYGTNSYRGSTDDFNDEVCAMLKNAGIKRVVSFLNFADSIGCCKKNGLETLWYPIGFDFWNEYMFRNEDIIKQEAGNDWYYFDTKDSKEEALQSRLKTWEYNKNNQVEHFVEFIQFMQKENVYAGCSFGRGRTDNVMMLNHFFNPKASKTQYCLSYNDDVFIERMMVLYGNLTPEHKARMGWDEEFDKKFIPKMQKLLDVLETR